MTISRLIITIDIDLPSENLSASTLQHLKFEQRNHTKALIFRGLKRAVKAFNCLQVQERRIDLRVFDIAMDFSDISFAVEDKVDGASKETIDIFLAEFNFGQDTDVCLVFILFDEALLQSSPPSAVNFPCCVAEQAEAHLRHAV